MDFIHLTQDRKRRRAIVYTVTNFSGISSLAERFQVGICSAFNHSTHKYSMKKLHNSETTTTSGSCTLLPPP